MSEAVPGGGAGLVGDRADVVVADQQRQFALSGEVFVPGIVAFTIRRWCRSANCATRAVPFPPMEPICAHIDDPGLRAGESRVSVITSITASARTAR
jgi:hypothetical protein